MRNNPFSFLVEPLIEEPSYVERPMFGCQACYLFGKLQLVLAAGDEPWNGVLVATAHEHHESLRAEFPELQSHPILGKWLYLSEDTESFERCAMKIVGSVLKGDPRIGVEPDRKRKRRKKKLKRTS